MGIADELITRGWGQGDLIDDDGHVCLEGACSFADFGDLRLESGRSFGAVRQLLWQRGIRVPYEWNDAPERTFDEVLRVAKEADELLDAS